MATATMTVPPPSQQRRPGKSKLPPENERFMQACSDIANALIQDHEAQRDSTKPKKDINLNGLRKQIGKKYSLSSHPPLTAIIAAVPEHYKKYILPRLIAKPIRTYFIR
jgi:elongator complex protein 3